MIFPLKMIIFTLGPAGWNLFLFTMAYILPQWGTDCTQWLSVLICLCEQQCQIVISLQLTPLFSKYCPTKMQIYYRRVGNHYIFLQV